MTDPPRVDTAPLPRYRHAGWLVALDIVTAAALTLLAVYSSLETPFGPLSWQGVLVWSMALAAGAPLVVRRRWPLPVLGVVLAASVVAVLLGMHGAAMGLPVAVACYPVAQSVAPRRSTVAFAAAVSGIVLAGVISASASSRVLAPNPDALNSDLVSSLGVSLLALVTAWALGRSARARHRYTTVLADHRAQQAVAEERLRIAREMHDVVAHSMSVIVMKAAVANHVYDSRPEESREALGVIESVGRGALADIGSVLGSLRSAGEADLTPSPGLDALPTLVQNARLAGVDVELDRADLPELPAALQLSAYRIVQEALTNVIKHAAPARCAVRVTAESGELCLTVVDDGTRGADREPGHGLIGMRERAALHHGTLLADRRPDGGFAVHARLPYQGADPHD